MPLSNEQIDQAPFSVLDGLFSWIQRYLSWARRPALSALLVITLSLLVAFPDIHHFTDWHPSWIEQALDWKMHHPLSAIPVEQYAKPGPDLLGASDHLRKESYRLTPFLLAYCLGLDVRGMEIMGALSSLAFSAVLLLYFRRLFPEDPINSLLLAISVACSLLGQWGTYVFSFFDGIGYLLLASAAYTKNPFFIALFVFAGGFSDERVILAAPLIYLLHDHSVFAGHWRALIKPNRRRYAVVAGAFLFIIGRIMFGIYIGHQFDRAQVGVGLHYNLIMFPLAEALVFKGATVVMAAGFLSLWTFRSALPALLLLACAFPSIASSLLVWDLCRSLGYSFPVLLFCAKALSESTSSQNVRRLALCGALLSACLPTYYLWEGKVEYLRTVSRLVTG